MSGPLEDPPSASDLAWEERDNHPPYLWPKAQDQHQDEEPK